MMRWGGIFADFYRWREGVGPRDKRPPMLNLLWGGIESNQVGTAEFAGLCRTVGAEPMICVNFESDGRQQDMKAKGSVRTADANEAAAWVAYCNDPGNAERKAHGTVDRSPFATGKSATKPLTTRKASTSKRRRVRPSNLPRRCAPPIRRSADCLGPAAGPGAWPTSPASTFSAWRSVTCSIPTHQKPVLRGELYRRDPIKWQQLMGASQTSDAKIPRRAGRAW